MFGLGTLVNTGAIILAGIVGRFVGKRLNDRLRDGLNLACGVSVIFLGIAGAVSGMLERDGDAFTSGRTMFVVFSLLLGALVGELVNIEGWFERFGVWLRNKTGNAKDKRFVDGFLTASLTVSIGAMAVVGSIADGIEGDPSILITKAILDFVIILVMSCSLGIGAIFSAIPVFVFQGTMTLLARLLKPLMTPLALANLSLIGSILIFCVGLNLVFGKKVRVANLLPSILFAVVFAFLPFSL